MQPYEFNNVLEFFLILYIGKDDIKKYILCELYMHNLFLEEQVDENPTPFIGDVQF